MEFKHKPNPIHTQILIQVRVLPLDTQILATQSSPYYIIFWYFRNFVSQNQRKTKIEKWNEKLIDFRNSSLCSLCSSNTSDKKNVNMLNDVEWIIDYVKKYYFFGETM